MLSQTSRLSLAFSQLRENPRHQLRSLCRHAARGLAATGAFLKTCFTDGLKALVAGRYTRKQAAIIIAGSLPAILGAMMITLPSVLFPTPGHQAFYHFASTLATDLSSMVPVALGTISSVLGLKIPLG
ncbi:MAG: hypothetical protein AAGI48_12990 [Verrucomicrobiota bacterium]